MCVAVLPRTMMCAAFQSPVDDGCQLVRRRRTTTARPAGGRRPRATSARARRETAGPSPRSCCRRSVCVRRGRTDSRVIANLLSGRHRVGHDDAAIVDAAVPAFGDAIVELQLEVGGRAAAPDDERVALDDGRRHDFADEHSVLGPPVGRIAFPSGERLAVEDRLKPGLVSGEHFGTIALLRRVRRLRFAACRAATRRRRDTTERE